MTPLKLLRSISAAEPRTPRLKLAWRSTRELFSRVALLSFLLLLVQLCLTPIGVSDEPPDRDPEPKKRRAVTSESSGRRSRRDDDSLYDRDRGREVRGPSTTVQLPTFGVAIDAAGLLSLKHFPDPGGRIMAARRAAATLGLSSDVRAWSDLRKVSLNRLDSALRRLVAKGLEPDEEMKYLAGLQRIQYVFCYPDSRGIVLAGPAEGFAADPSGRLVGISTHQPTLRLDDLAVALRAYPPGTRTRPFVGCTISPNPEGLARLQAFQKKIPHAIPQQQRRAAAVAISRGVHDSLGTAAISVYGISNKTHFAQVLIEADYRMKRIAIGLEPPPVKMVTFLQTLGTPKHLSLQQWWFTPEYTCVRVSPSGDAMQLVGRGVQLQDQVHRIGPDGSLVKVSEKASSGATRRYAQSFTDKYPEIGAAVPVFAQLRNQIDMLVAAAFMQSRGLYEKASCNIPTLLDETSLATETLRNPTSVEAAINVIWRRNRLLCPAGGGVSIDAYLAMEPDHLLPDPGGQLDDLFVRVKEEPTGDRWWWD